VAFDGNTDGLGGFDMDIYGGSLVHGVASPYFRFLYYSISV
jgi:hypothetical protein